MKITKELSVFVDESGDFGAYEKHSPFYIFTLVFHDQERKIDEQIHILERHLKELGLKCEHCFHAGPLIRREGDYLFFDIKERRKILNSIISFTKHIDISYKSFVVRKDKNVDSLGLTASLTQYLSIFIREHKNFFDQFDKIVLYYDNGQVELNKILVSVFTIIFTNFEYRKVFPSDYRLFQVADLICTFELVKTKYNENIVSHTEEQFFGNTRNLKKNYLKIIEKIQIDKKNSN